MRFNRFNRLNSLLGGLRALCGAAVLCGLPLLSQCSRSDVITGAGSSVVSAADSSLTDVVGGFATVYITDTAVGTAFSLPYAPDPLFGTRLAGHIIIGVSEEGDTVAAHIQYSVAGDTSYKAEDSLIGAYVRFGAVSGDSGAASEGVTLFASAPLRGFAPVDRADKDRGASSGDTAAGKGVGSLSPGGGEADTLRLPDNLADSLFRARASRDASAVKTIAFSIVDYTGKLLKMDDPYIVIVRGRRDCCIDTSWTLSDTVRGLSRYTAFESDSAAAKRAREPYSSQLTQRTAVFKLNAAKILDSLSSLYGLSGDDSELLNAVVTVRYHEPNASAEPSEEPSDSSETVRLSSLNPSNYKALILDTLLTRDVDTLTDSASHLLRYRFAKGAGAVKLTAPYNTHSFKAPLRSVISKYAPGDSAFVYVYLRPTTDYSAVWWCKPAVTYRPNLYSVTVEAVFTPHGGRRARGGGGGGANK